MDLNSRAENSHQPTRILEKVMHCRCRRDAGQKRHQLRTQAYADWNAVSCAHMVAV
jgi:hypothetical protein